MNIEINYTQTVQTIIVVVVYFLLRILLKLLIGRTTLDKVVQHSRIQLTRRVLNLILLLVALAVLMIIWGVKQSEIAIFISSILTIIGVAFFAQWSLLSNITSSVILFFGHSVRIGDTISIMESKDYEISGVVLSIGLFFITIRLSGSEDIITLPTNVFIQKTIRNLSPQSLAEYEEDKVHMEG